MRVRSHVCTQSHDRAGRPPAMQEVAFMSKLRSLPRVLRSFDTSTTRLPPRRVDPIYNSPQFIEWRAIVISRANGQCEAIVNGQRCTKAKPSHRVYADHIIELRDGGAPFDPSNGQCLCHSHHEIKTLEARKKRHGIS